MVQTLWFIAIGEISILTLACSSQIQPNVGTPTIPAKKQMVCRSDRFGGTARENIPSIGSATPGTAHGRPRPSQTSRHFTPHVL